MQTPEALRAAAIDALDAHADPRVAEILEHAWITLVPGVKQWVASSGTVTAHTVRLDVDARALAWLRASPGLHDRLVAAFSTAIAHDGAHALASLEVYWGFEPTSAARGYRDGAEKAISHTDPGALSVALPVYLATRGEPDLAAAVQGAVIELEPGRGRLTAIVHLGADGAARFEHDARAGDLLDEAVHALLADPSGVKIRCVRRVG
jgi:hypothetical protein